MKDKIYQLLKQTYSSLELADDVLQAQAEMLDKLGIVTEDNVDTVIETQKSYLESLQKENDRRVTEAQKKFQAEQLAKEEAEKKAKEEAERKAKEEAERKAQEELERKKLEDLQKQKEMPEYLKKFFEEQAAKDKAKEEAQAKEREEYKKLIEELKKSSEDQKTAFAEQTKQQNDVISSLQDTIKKQQEEAKAKEEAAAKAKALADHKAKILSKAKELGIPQFRIDEGFTIADDADDETISNVLTKVANNIKTLQQPTFGGGLRANLDEKATKEQVDNVASALVDSL